MLKTLLGISTLVIVAISAGLVFMMGKTQEKPVPYTFQKAAVSILYPQTMNVNESGNVLLEVSDNNISILIKRILHETDPSRTGGDRCLPPPKDTPLTEIGTLDSKAIFRGQRAGTTNYEYFAKDTSQTCYLMPIFTKKFPEFDNISVNFTFKSPDLSDLEKQKYTQIADQIVLSLKDTAKP